VTTKPEDANETYATCWIACSVTSCHTSNRNKQYGKTGLGRASATVPVRHAATGVSPKEWCEAQGLNYATARRYQKTLRKLRKNLRRKMRTAQKDKSANELVDDDGLTAQQRLFVAEYLKDNNATAAAARAGYSDPNYGRQLITNPNVAQAIAQQQKASIVRTLGSADEVLAQMWQLATFDANQLSQYRRGACRYCWGFGHQYQWRDAVEFEEKRLEAKEREA
jgi:hypothetical protein